MFRNHVEFWLNGKDSHVVSYIQAMLDNGHDTLSDFQKEIDTLTEKMDNIVRHGVDFQYFWSVRSWIEECILWYAPL